MTDSLLGSAAGNLSDYRLMAETLDSLHIGLCLFDDEDRVLLWNQSFVRLFPEHAGHIAVGEHYRLNLQRFYTARLRPDHLHSMEQSIVEGLARHHAQSQPFIFEHRGQWLRVASQPVPNVGRIRIWTPIAPPRADSAFEPGTARARLPEIMPFAAGGGDGASIVDGAGRISSANALFATFFGLADPAEAIGRTHAEVYAAAWAHEPGGAEMAGLWLNTLAEGERFTGAPFELPLPQRRWLRVLQQRTPDGPVVSSFADISAMKALQRELGQAREAAETANRAKDGFLATVSHELRTPMNGVLGMLDLLDDGGLSTEQAQRVSIARQSAEALLGLVDEILAFSRLEARPQAREWSPTRPGQILDAVARLMQPRATQKGLALRWMLEADVPDAVLGDPERLRQVLLNLIGNAVKFTERGSVTLAARRGADLPGDRFALEFMVEDTGIGIAPTAQATIFDPFIQADDGIGRRFGGTGLGLAICRRLVRAMDGEISVESAPGQGSRFTFKVACKPLRPSASAAPLPNRPAVVPELLGLRVLVVDDHPTNREVARLQLERLGLIATTVQGGAEAVLACQEPFGLILMDLEMPGMDGFAALRAIRSSGLPAAQAPVIALTAHVGSEHRARCLDAGMTGVVTKPIRAAELAAAITMAVAPAAGTSAPPPMPPAPAATGGTLDIDRTSFLVENIAAADWRRILTEFETDAREVVGEITAAAEHGLDHRQPAHRLKGAAWNLGAHRLGDLAAVMEGLLPREIASRLPELRQVLEQSMSQLHDLERTAGSGQGSALSAERSGEMLP